MSHVKIPRVVFFFGLAGAGKSFAGRTIAPRIGYYYHELDEDLTPELQLAINAKQPFTEAMRDQYFDKICRRLTELKAEHAGIIVTQGAYKKRHREMVTRAHPDLEFVCVSAPESLILERFKHLPTSVDLDYALALAKNFEPTPEAKVLLNDQDAETLYQRFVAIFSS